MRKNVTSDLKKCEVCGKEYSPTSNRQVFCIECRKERERQQAKAKHKRTYVRKGYNQLGENNNNWKGGDQHYYQRIAFEAYGRICNRCYSEENILVHHKNHNHKDNEISNLEVLCKKCHQHEHKCWKALGSYIGANDRSRDSKGRFTKTP